MMVEDRHEALRQIEALLLVELDAHEVRFVELVECRLMRGWQLTPIQSAELHRLSAKKLGNEPPVKCP